MKADMTFDQIVGIADGLPLPEKESLVEILSKRLIQERRLALRADSREANQEFKAGKARPASAAGLMREIAG